jgi:hypothetical protein
MHYLLEADGHSLLNVDPCEGEEVGDNNSFTCFGRHFYDPPQTDALKTGKLSLIMRFQDGERGYTPGWLLYL